MAETQESEKRISIIPPRTFSGQYKISKENDHETRPLQIRDWHHAAQILLDFHPWTIFPEVIKAMVKGQTIIFMQKNPDISRKELREYLWDTASPLLEAKGMLVEVTEQESASKGLFRVIGITLVTKETRDKITDIIDPGQEQACLSPKELQGFIFEDENPTSPGTPTAKKQSDNP